jgi:hypothetical protein
MFWKKKTPKTPKWALVIQAYLSVNTTLLPERETNPVTKAAIQVFVLGMTDMLRQSEKLSTEEFLNIFSTVLSQQNLLPKGEIQEFVYRIAGLAGREEAIDNLLRQGAQSIMMYVVEKEANAPLDLLSAVKFAEKNASVFGELV